MTASVGGAGTDTRVFKTSASGNDFIVVAALDDPGWGWTAEQVRAACARRHSVGADGVIALLPSSRGTARFRLWNSDASGAAFSGNGARCAARVLDELGRSADGEVVLECDEALVHARVDGGRVELELPLPRDVELGLDLLTPAGRHRCHYAVVGVPYVVVQADDVDAVDLPRVAPPLRWWHAFPQGANVAFHEPHVEGEPVRLRTWERGVEGETLSSGTGCYAVALAVAAARGALAPGAAAEERRVMLAPRSGAALSVTLATERGEVTRARLDGDARLVAELTLLEDAFAT